MLDLNVVKQVVTEITGVDGDLFRVGKRFLESKGRIYLSYSVENEKGDIKDYKFSLEIKECEIKFMSYKYHEERLGMNIYVDHNEKESFIWENNLFGKDKKEIKENGDFIRKLNEKLNR